MARLNGRKRRNLREKQARLASEVTLSSSERANLYRYHSGQVIVSHNVNAHTRLYSGENGYRAKVGVPKLMREGHEKTTWRTWSNK
jgi:hypothetical protein